MNNVLLSLDIRRLLVLEMKANECTKWSKDAPYKTVNFINGECHKRPKRVKTKKALE